MTTTPLHSVRLTEPGEFLAAVPHLLGFHPEDSLVVTTLGGASGPGRVGVTARVDLPPPQQWELVAEQLACGPVAHDGASSVIVAIIGGHSNSGLFSRNGEDQQQHLENALTDALPHSDLVTILRDKLSKHGITILNALWTAEISAGSQWSSYGDQSAGEIADPSASPLAAAMTACGAITFKSRDELTELLAAEPAADLARRSARLSTMHEDAELESSGGRCEHDIDVTFEAIRRTGSGETLSEDELLAVLLAVSDHRVRDVAMSAALTEWSDAAERLWLTLVKKAPEPEMAEVAALLAFSAYLRGDGALASVALDRIRQRRPEHQLGQLLRQALDAGIHPRDLAVIAADAAADARIMLEEDGSW